MTSSAEIDDMALYVRARLEHMLDVMDVVEARGSNNRSVPVRVPRPLCAEIDLDFLSYDAGDRHGAITKTTPKKWFKRHLAVCESCGVKDPCLERALEAKEEFGIWGGMMPAERRKLYG